LELDSGQAPDILLCITATHNLNQTEIENEYIRELNLEVDQLTHRFLRLLRRQVPHKPFHLPTDLLSSVRYNRSKPSPHWRLMASLGPIHVLMSDVSQNVTRQDWHDLKKALASGEDTEIWEEVLLDARAALSDSDLKRATLYAAVSCEVFIKEYTSKASREVGICKEFWTYLGSRQPRVQDYYDSILMLVSGHSLKTEKPEMYKLVERLFKARNELMHEGHFSPRKQLLMSLESDINTVNDIIAWVRSTCKRD